MKNLVISLFFTAVVLTQNVPPPPQCETLKKEKDCLALCGCYWNVTNISDGNVIFNNKNDQGVCIDSDQDHINHSDHCKVMAGIVVFGFIVIASIAGCGCLVLLVYSLDYFLNLGFFKCLFTCPPNCCVKDPRSDYFEL